MSETRERLRRLYQAAIGGDAYPGSEWSARAYEDYMALLAALSTPPQSEPRKPDGYTGPHEVECLRDGVGAWIIPEPAEDEPAFTIPVYIGSLPQSTGDTGAVSPDVYESAVHGRQQFRTALRNERENTANLADDLQRYGGHHDDCYWLDPEYHPDGCNCGWAQTITRWGLDCDPSSPPPPLSDRALRTAPPQEQEPVAWLVRADHYTELWTARRKANAEAQVESLRAGYPNSDVALIPLYATPQGEPTTDTEEGR